MQRIIVDLKTGTVNAQDIPEDEVLEIARQAAEIAAANELAMLPLDRIQLIEKQNPITHRALRELILTIGEAYPAGKNTVFYQRVLAAELAIQSERAKL